MSLSLTINGVDFTSKWRLYESRWTSRAFEGESSQSEFVIDDDAGDIDHADLASRKIVEVWEDASGSPVCMYRGRVANKTLGRSPRLTALSMRWIVSAEDYNIDLRGLRVTDSSRGEESDRERFLAYMAAYLNGAGSFNAHARDTTELDGGHVVNADLVTLPAEDYQDTFPAEVFARICEISAKTFFVFVDDAGQGQLYYATHTDTSYSSDISITDAGTADGVDIFAPYVSNNSGEHDGQRTITGGGVRYGDDEFFELSDVAGSEADHDKWEEHFTDEYLVNVGSATSFITNQVASRNNEDFTFVATIDMRAEDAHRVKAGMMVPVLMRSADKPASSEQRAVQVTHEPQHPDEDGNARYAVTIEFGVPRGRPFRRNIRRRPTSKPIPGPGECRQELEEDFGRTVTDAWGESEFGTPWVQLNAATEDERAFVSGSEGVFLWEADTFPTSMTATLPGFSIPCEVRVRWRYNDEGTFADLETDPLWDDRWLSLAQVTLGNIAYMAAEINYDEPSAGDSDFIVVVNPTPAVPLGAVTIYQETIPNDSRVMSYAWFALRYESTMIKAKFWWDDQPEPATWEDVTPDSTPVPAPDGITLHSPNVAGGQPDAQTRYDLVQFTEGLDNEVCPTTGGPEADEGDDDRFAHADHDHDSVDNGDAAGGDTSGTYPNLTVDAIQGITISGTPAIGDVPTATSTSAATWQNPGGGASLLVSDDYGLIVPDVTLLSFGGAFILEYNPGEVFVVQRFVSQAKWGND